MRMAIAVLLITSTTAAAQTITPEQGKRAVYRCIEDGKTTYSHVPCIDAKVVETTPTQGLDKSSGRTMRSPDVQQEQHRDLIHRNLYKPLLGETKEQSEKRHRWAKLEPGARAECQRLDPLMKSESGQRLYDVRMLYYKFNC